MSPAQTSFYHALPQPIVAPPHKPQPSFLKPRISWSRRGQNKLHKILFLLHLLKPERRLDSAQQNIYRRKKHQPPVGIKKRVHKLNNLQCISWQLLYKQSTSPRNPVGSGKVPGKCRNSIIIHYVPGLFLHRLTNTIQSSTKSSSIFPANIPQKYGSTTQSETMESLYANNSTTCSTIIIRDIFITSFYSAGICSNISSNSAGGIAARSSLSVVVKFFPRPSTPPTFFTSSPSSVY